MWMGTAAAWVGLRDASHASSRSQCSETPAAGIGVDAGQGAAKPMARAPPVDGSGLGLQTLQQCLVEAFRSLYLRGMAKVGEFHQGRLGNPSGGVLAQLRVVAQPGFQFCRRGVLADGGVVFLADQQQGRHLQPVQFVDHRLGEDHVVGQRRVPGHRLAPLAAIHAGLHLYPAIELGAPFAGVVGGLLVLANAFGAGLQVAPVPVVDTAPGHAQGLPVLQTDGVDQHQSFDLPRVEQGVAGSEHAAHGMADHAGPGDAEPFQQGVGVGCQLLEAVLVMGRLARLAEADLVDGDHPVAGVGEHVDGALPGPGAEILAVHEQDGAAVGFLRRDVEVGHAQRLALGGEVQIMHRIGVVEAFQAFAVDRRLAGQRRPAGEGETETEAG